MTFKYRWSKVFLLGMMALAAGSAQAQGAAKRALPADWPQLVERANKEGKLILFGQPNVNYRNKMIAGFNKQYPRIRVEYRAASRSGELTSKIAAEKRAGVHEVDLVLWGADAIYSDLLRDGYVTPIKDLLVLPDFSDSSKWINGKLEYSDKEEKYALPYAQFAGKTFIVNKQLVDVSRVKSHEDLLDPKFAGKIVVTSPKDAGQARYAFGFLYSYFGEDFFKRFAAQKPVLVKETKQLIEWVAHGKYAMGISPGNADAYQEMVDAGIPVTGMGSTELKEGGYYSPGFNNIASVKDAPHPNAAKLFANWLFTKEGQEVVIDALVSGKSVRTDVGVPMTFEKDKKYYAPHLEKNQPTQQKGIDMFTKYIQQ